MNIILICINNFQNYIWYNIVQLLDLGYNVIVVTNKNFFHKFNYFSNITLINGDEFDINQDKIFHSFEDDFWGSTSKRLFLLYYVMKKYNYQNCIHLENDVLLYYNFKDYKFENKIYLTMDADNRCIPGIIYIPEYKYLSNLILNYKIDKNDMINMALFYQNNKDICVTFPIIKQNNSYNFNDNYSENFNLFGGIFDAAAIGQYLGGYFKFDKQIPKNVGEKCINETCIINYNNYKFFWKKIKNRWFPYIEIEKQLIPIMNLHIHSKQLKNFLIFKPIEERMIKFLE